LEYAAVLGVLLLYRLIVWAGEKMRESSPARTKVGITES
jgi:hypothetical protein